MKHQRLLIFLILGLLLLPVAVTAVPINIPLIEDLDLYNEMRESKGLPPIELYDLPPENVLYLVDREAFDTWIEEGGEFPYDLVASFYEVPYFEGRYDELDIASLTRKRLEITEATDRINGETGYRDMGEASVLQMILSAKGRAVPRAELEAALQKRAAEAPELLPTERFAEVLNDYVFGFKNPLPETGPGYRAESLKAFHPDFFQGTYGKFYRRVIRNIADGYPMPLCCDRGILYPGEAGDQWVLLTGYIQNKDQAIIAFYVVDPNPRTGDPFFGGLKYITPYDLMLAIYHSYDAMYLW